MGIVHDCTSRTVKLCVQNVIKKYRLEQKLCNLLGLHVALCIMYMVGFHADNDERQFIIQNYRVTSISFRAQLFCLTKVCFIAVCVGILVLPSSSFNVNI